jgi:YcxB-like protein
MTLGFSLTREDFFQFNYYTSWAAPEKKEFRVRYYLKTIGYALAAILILYFIERPGNAVRFFTIGIVIAIIWGLIVGYYSMQNSFKKRIKSFAEDQNNSTFFTKTELMLTEFGIVSRDENSEVKYNWDAIVKRAETKDYIYLYLNVVQAIVIPKRILSPDDKKELNELLNKNLSLKAEFNELYV